MSFDSEATLQALVLQAIHADNLNAIIDDNSGIKDNAEALGSTYLPNFSIDRLCRDASIAAGARVLNSMSSLIFLSADKNVSMTTSESLRPDIICYNPDTETVVLFELKNSSKPGRQAISEFIAYEQEIKNHLPLLAERDICMVLISSEWSTLMDHGVSAAITWAGKNILCLEAYQENGELRLRTHIPTAWHITGAVHLPTESLATATLCLYAKDEFLDQSLSDNSNNGPLAESDWSEAANIPFQLRTAVDVIAREGDRAGGHGFVMLWLDHSQQSGAKYNLTICSISPFALYENNLVFKNDGAAETTTDFVVALNKMQREFPSSGHSKTLFSIGNSARSILEEVADPIWENMSTWDSDRVSMCLRAEPVIFEFWGTVGEYVRNYVLHPMVRKSRQMLLLNGVGDWRDPEVAIPLITQFSRPIIFSTGLVRWHDAFQLGVFAGLDRLLRENIRSSSEPSLEGALRCRFVWNRADFVLAMDEMVLIADSTENVEAPKEPIGFFHNPLAEDQMHFDNFVKWTCEEFFQENPGHINAFLVGLNAAPLFDKNAMERLISPNDRSAILARVEEQIREVTIFVLENLTLINSTGNLLPDGQVELRNLLLGLGLKRGNWRSKIKRIETETLLSSWRICLKASDWITHGVLHLKPSLPNKGVDWEWLKQGVLEAHERGEFDVGVILSANGNLCTGSVSIGGGIQLIKIKNPLEEVLFLDETAAFTTVVKMSWDELVKMEKFPGQGKKSEL